PFGLALGGAQQLFLLGGLAIALGVFTYSHRVMSTVGGDLFKLTPQMALVVVLALSVVLFLFSSQDLERALLRAGLPALPLVPISSSQAVVGAVVGLGLLKGGHGIRYRVLVDIAAGWVTTPIIAGLLAFVGLFFLQNVFAVPVNRPRVFELSPQVIERVGRLGVPCDGLGGLRGEAFTTQMALNRKLRAATALDAQQRTMVLDAALVAPCLVDSARVVRVIGSGRLGIEQVAAIRVLSGREYRHGWQLIEALESLSPDWRPQTGNAADRLRNDDLDVQRRLVLQALKTAPGADPPPGP
ncbi:MAG: inorganic phosphate transporter, partial [Candidatus Latescibacteria bacterium]|nr:inorganic phosphate transporter [Candidatus Latescibacterota bacterium]